MIRVSQTVVERAGALALLGLAVGLVWIAAVLPFVGAIDSRRTTLSDLADQHRNYRIRRTSIVLDADEELLKKIEASLYPPTPPGIAVSRLQTDHQTIARNAKLQITGTHVRPEINGEVVTGISLQVSASGTIDELESYLNEVGRHPQLLHVENVSIFAPERQTGDRNPVLSMTWTLTGIVENVEI